MDENIELIKEVATLKANQQNMYDQQNNTLNKIESLVESNYAVVGSIELLTRQLGDYSRKVDDQAVLLNEVAKETNDKINMYQKLIDQLENNLNNTSHGIDSTINMGKEYYNKLEDRIKELEQFVDNHQQKGYKIFKGFMNDLSSKTQSAISIAIVGLLGLCGRDIVEYFITLLQK